LLEAYAEETGLIGQSVESIGARGAAIQIHGQEGNKIREGSSLAILAMTLVRAGRNAEGEEASRMSIEVLEARPPSSELASAYRVQAAIRMLNSDAADAVT
jgi:hypothetical protein